MKRRDFFAASALPLALAACSGRPEIDGGFVGALHERGHLLRAPMRPTAPAKTARCRVLVVGAGIAGLAAARALRLQGVDDVAVLELEDGAGGNSRAGTVRGVPCPLGAHYLPVPGEGARDVQDLLEELGLRRRVAGRWTYDERALCHSPQERLFIGGQWQEGLLPAVPDDARAQDDYRRFSHLVRQAATAAVYSIPVSNQAMAPGQRALDAMTFVAWLTQNGLHSTALRWYLDYCCRDDYGAGIDTVSAWAGIHYFASRHGFSAPGTEPAGGGDRNDAGVLTWPEGNGWLARQLAQPLGDRLHAGCVVLRVAAGRHGVEVDALDVRTQSVERWQAAHCIVACPLFVAARVVEHPPAALLEAAALLRYAPWLVANIHIDAALHDRPGAAPSWDNVIHQAGPDGEVRGGLGYVDALHQDVRSVPGATVLTHYRAPGLGPAARRELLERPWSHWRDTVLSELSVPHPDLAGKVTRIEVMRYGHAMSTPVPGIRSSAALQALQRTPQVPRQRLHFAHSDLSGYSVFEEAFTQGHQRGTALAQVGV
ncbi:MAG: hypothetical protein JWQ72_116 [Polaromonas sp.]|nr:hypothetical protein [Polaromonas sp.]